MGFLMHLFLKSLASACASQSTEVVFSLWCLFQSPCLSAALPNTVSHSSSLLKAAPRLCQEWHQWHLPPIRQVSQGQACVLFGFLIMTGIYTQMPLNPSEGTARHTLISNVGKGNMSLNRRKGIYIFIFMKRQPKYEHWRFCNNSSYKFGFVVSKIRNFLPQRVCL